MKKPIIKSSQLVFDGRAVKLRIETILKENGHKTTGEIVEHTPAVAMVALDAENNILMVKQYREAVKQELLEIPAGSIDPGEDIETAVKREMQEETGFLPQEIVKLCGFYAAPGYCPEFMHVYLATDLVPGRLHAEDTDEIVLEKVPAKEIPALLRSGRIIDAKTMAGLYACRPAGRDPGRPRPAQPRRRAAAHPGDARHRAAQLRDRRVAPARVLALWLRVLPVAGYGSARHLVLPAIALGAPFAACLARLARAGLLEALARDHIRTAIAFGLPPWRIVVGHALQSACLPVVSYRGPAAAGVLTGGLVIERIFAIPGLGTLLIDSVVRADFPILQGRW